MVMKKLFLAGLIGCLLVNPLMMGATAASKQNSLKLTTSLGFGILLEYERALTNQDTIFVEYGGFPSFTYEDEAIFQKVSLDQGTSYGIGLRHYFADRFVGFYVGASYNHIDIDYTTEFTLLSIQEEDSVSWSGPMLELGYDFMFFDTVTTGFRLRGGYGKLSGTYPDLPQFDSLPESDWVSYFSADWKVLGLVF